MFNGNQPELGKSVLAQVLAILRDGQPVETATYNANDEEFEKRLGAIVRRGLTTIIIDNAKARGRNPRIDSACLERSITDPILSFRLLGFSQEIRAENSHLFCITANTPDVSRDLITRCVVINLYHEGEPRRRTFVIADPEGYPSSAAGFEPMNRDTSTNRVGQAPRADRAADARLLIAASKALGQSVDTRRTGRPDEDVRPRIAPWQFG